MSSAARAGVRPRYGSTWIATSSPCRVAACSTSSRRSFSGESKPHHETTIVPTPALAISRICAATIFAFDDEYRPRLGKYSVERTGVPSRSTYQCAQLPSFVGVEYHG